MNDSLYGATRMQVASYLALRRQHMGHEKACEHVGVDPVVFVPKPGEARAFTRR